MRLLVLSLAVIGVVAAAPAFAAQDIRYGPAPAWVKHIDPPPAKASVRGSTETLLIDKQTYFGRTGDELHVATARKVLTPQGLRDMGTLGTLWDPARQTLTINRAAILRDGRTIDLLAGGDRFTVLRREANLDQAVLDGTLTAVMQIKGLRVGDVVLFESSYLNTDPLLRGHAEAMESIAHRGIVDRLRYRHVWPKSRPIRWRASEFYGPVQVTETADHIELVADYTDIAALMPPEDAPGRFAIPARFDLTDFTDWNEISALMAPLFKTAATLPSGASLKAEARRIMAEHPDQETRALAALQLVENQVRYLAITMGAGGFTPTNAQTAWEERFGDCKAKTVMLMALLGELGVKAEAAMVVADGGDGLDELLPQVGAFDHVIVRAQINGRTYWLDGTRVGDRSLAFAANPNFRWALPVRGQGAPLERIMPQHPSLPLFELVSELDATAGLDVAGPGHVRILARGDEAVTMETAMAGRERRNAEQALQAQWGAELSWLKVERTEFGWDEGLAAYRIDFFGAGQFDWKREGAVRSINVADEFGPQFDQRAGGPYAEAPFDLDFPYHTTQTSRIRLPKGASFELSSGDVDLTAGQIRVVRKSRIADGELIVESSIEALAAEVPFKEALAAVETYEASPISKALRLHATMDVAAAGPAVQDLTLLDR